LPVLGAEAHDSLRVVRREPAAPDEIGWDPEAGIIDAHALAGVDAIVNLAGYSIGSRWTESRKRRIVESRVGGTTLLAETAAALEPRPHTLICAGGVGAYGDRGDEVLTEESPRGEGFLADVAERGEAAAQPAREAGTRVATFRH